MNQQNPLPDPRHGVETRPNWARKIERALEARKAGQDIRDKKPATSSEPKNLLKR